MIKHSKWQQQVRKLSSILRALQSDPDARCVMNFMNRRNNCGIVKPVAFSESLADLEIHLVFFDTEDAYKVAIDASGFCVELDMSITYIDGTLYLMFDNETVVRRNGITFQQFIMFMDNFDMDDYDFTFSNWKDMELDGSVNMSEQGQIYYIGHKNLNIFGL